MASNVQLDAAAYECLVAEHLRLQRTLQSTLRDRDEVTPALVGSLVEALRHEQETSAMLQREVTELARQRWLLQQRIASAPGGGAAAAMAGPHAYTQAPSWKLDGASAPELTCSSSSFGGGVSWGAVPEAEQPGLADHLLKVRAHASAASLYSAKGAARESRTRHPARPAC